MIRRLPPERQHLFLLLALTFSSGVIDAVGFLGLDRVFTGNMTGNVVILGMAIVGAEDLPVYGPALALLGFMVGAAAGGRVLKHAEPGWSVRITGALTVVGTVILALAAVVVVSDSLPRPLALIVTLVLGTVMGLQAATARFMAFLDVTTIVVTSTITGLAADSKFGSGAGSGMKRRAAAVALILVGAATGAALLRIHIGAGLFAAGLITLVVAAVGASTARPVA